MADTQVRDNRKRVFVLSIDGVPYTLLQRLAQRGDMPNLASLLAERPLVRYNSTLPWVSSVAWSTYMTGMNPGKHGIYGFVDRQPGSYKTYIPTSRHMRAETLWEYLSRLGKRVVVMNVPVTYPPRPVNGVLIGCFLSPSIDKCAYPPEVSQKLKELGYRIDADPYLAQGDKTRLADELDLTLDKRAEAMFYFMEHEDWDFFHCHVMETDRLHHFLWREMEDEHPTLAARFYGFYRRLDDVIGRLRERLPAGTEWMILSDHGFCRIEQEVYVNAWLERQGWLAFDVAAPKSWDDISPRAVAYSLDPGRIYLHVRGREPKGCVAPGPGGEYERLREEIAAAALQWTDPSNGKHVFQAAWRREQIYHGPCLDAAPDLVLQPTDGYDPKGALHKDGLFFHGPTLVGMHTFDDACLWVRGHAVRPGTWSILDATPTILHLMGLPIPAYVDGQSVLAE